MNRADIESLVEQKKFVKAKAKKEKTPEELERENAARLAAKAAKEAKGLGETKKMGDALDAAAPSS